MESTCRKIVLDIETNGLDKIVQISYFVIDYNNKIMGNVDMYLNDGNNDVGYFNKFNIDFIKEYGIHPSIALIKLSNDIKQCECIIGHNIDYNIRCITAYCSTYNIKITIPEKKYCTMMESKNIVKCTNKLGVLKFPKLSETCKYFNIDLDDNKCHDSLYDIGLTLRCYIRLINT
jgi:DNA polymerase III epsilon subunit-like protein